MALSLAHFPDLCLLNVFKRLPLHDVIRSAGGVCHNWARLQRTELKRRRLLVLVQVSPVGFGHIQKECNPFGNNLIERVRRDDGSPWIVPPHRDVNKLKFESLCVPGQGLLTAAFASPLMRTMQNVTHLIVWQNGGSFFDNDAAIEVLHQLCRMLKHWSASLVSVKIDFFTVFSYGIFHFDAQVRARYELIADHFLDSINQLPVLRHLHLKVSFDALALSTSMQPILRRLDTITIGRFGINEWFSSLGDWIGNTNGGDKPQIFWPTTLSLADLHRVDDRVAGNFVRLLLDDYLWADDYEPMRIFSARFCSLTSLYLIIHMMPVTMLARALATLSQLVYLKLDFRYSITREEPNNADGRDNTDDEDADEDAPFELIITPLPSVRLLTLKFRTESHLDTEHLYPDQLFPNLQVLDLKHTPFRCYESDCGYDSMMTHYVAQQTVSDRHRIEHCMHLARQPFRRCFKLHTVQIKPLDGHNETIIDDLTYM